MGPAAQPRIDGELHVGDRLVRPAGRAGAGGPARPRLRRPAGPGRTARRPGRFCLTPRGGPVALGGMLGLQARPGRADARGARGPDARRRLVPPAGRRAAHAPLAAARRRPPRRALPAGLGRAVDVLGRDAAAHAARSATRRCACSRAPSPASGRACPPRLAVGLVALVNGAVFATFTPAFQTPDEPDHVGLRPGPRRDRRTARRATPRRGAFSQEEVIALDGVARVLDASSGSTGGRRGCEADLDRWRATARRKPLGRDEGGGPTTAAVAPARLLPRRRCRPISPARDSGFFASLWAMRLVSALLGALTAACTVLFIRELAPRASPGAAVLGGLLVAVPAAVRVHVRRGQQRRGDHRDLGGRAVADGARPSAAACRGRRCSRSAPSAALVVLFKQTGIALYPAIFAAVALGRRRACATGAALLGLAAARSPASRPAARDHARRPARDAGPASWARRGGGLIEAGGVVRTVLERADARAELPLADVPAAAAVHDRPVHRLVAAGHGHLRARGLRLVRLVHDGVRAAGCTAASRSRCSRWAHRRSRRAGAIARGLAAQLPQLALVGLSIAGVIGGVTAGLRQTASPRSGELPEQGRYAFTALPALAARRGRGGATGCRAAGGRSRRGGVLAALLALLWAGADDAAAALLHLTHAQRRRRT